MSECCPETVSRAVFSHAETDSHTKACSPDPRSHHPRLKETESYIWDYRGAFYRPSQVFQYYKDKRSEIAEYSVSCGYTGKAGDKESLPPTRWALYVSVKLGSWLKRLPLLV